MNIFISILRIFCQCDYIHYIFQEFLTNVNTYTYSILREFFTNVNTYVIIHILQKFLAKLEIATRKNFKRYFIIRVKKMTKEMDKSKTNVKTTIF